MLLLVIVNGQYTMPSFTKNAGIFGDRVFTYQSIILNHFMQHFLINNSDVIIMNYICIV